VPDTERGICLLGGFMQDGASMHAGEIAFAFQGVEIIPDRPF
jgi:hypothetical protein